MIRIQKYTKGKQLLTRVSQNVDVSAAVSAILRDVAEKGDEALLYYTERFDGAKLDALRVSRDELQEALAEMDPGFLRILERAAENIRRFHSQQQRQGFILREKGVVMGQLVQPLERVGMYVPGGRAAYPSTVLMDTIPAKLAGCSRIVMVTPPNREGKVNPAILAAASVAGVDEIYKVGGAQAIGALAYGTETVPAVDKIVGPGNAYVAEAKKQVYGRVSIEMIAGPSEILIVADGASNPAHLAADMLSQAEHDPMASAVLLTDDPALAEKVAEDIERQLPLLAREEIARASVEENGAIWITASLEEAVALSNDMAPEHLELCVDAPFDLLPLVQHAGSVFLGRFCPEALGDYMAGPNHTLPTGGTARFSSPLSVDDFVKKTQYTYFTRDALSEIAEDTALFAEAEGLTGHARSSRIRLEEGL